LIIAERRVGWNARRGVTTMGTGSPDSIMLTLLARGVAGPMSLAAFTRCLISYYVP